MDNWLAISLQWIFLGVLIVFFATSKVNVVKNLLQFIFIWLAISVINLPSEIFKLLVLIFTFTSIIVWRVFFKHYRLSKTSLFATAMIFTTVVLSLNFLQKIVMDNIVAALTFLGLGFDNAGHLRIFAERIPSEGDFALNGYPGGQSSTWYLIARISKLSMDNYQTFLATFAVLVLLTYLGLCFAAYAYVKSRGVLNDFSSAILIALLFIFGGFTYLLVSGYQPYIFATLIILLTMIAVDRSRSNLETSLILTTSLIILVFTNPPMAFAVAAVLLHSIYRLIKEFSNSHSNQAKKVLSIFILVSALVSGYLLFKILQIFNWRVILDLGGIEPLNNRFVIVLCFSFIFALTPLIARSKQIKQVSTEVVLSIVLSAAAITFLTIKYNGSITYYAIKQIHVAALLAAVLVIRLWNIDNSKKNRIAKIFLVFGFVLLQTYPTLRPTIFTTYFMGSGKNALELLIEQRSQWRNQVIDSRFIIQAAEKINLKVDECAVIWSGMQDSDLAGRWLNEMFPSQISECWYLNLSPTPRSREEILATITNPMFKVVLVTSGVNVSLDELTAIKNSQDRIVSLP